MRIYKYLINIGARKPDSQFVKTMYTLKSNLEAHIPTLLIGNETMLMPTPLCPAVTVRPRVRI